MHTAMKYYEVYSETIYTFEFTFEESRLERIAVAHSKVKQNDAACDSQESDEFINVTNRTVGVSRNEDKAQENKMTKKSQSQNLRVNIMKEDLETDIGNAQEGTDEVKDSDKMTRGSRSKKSNVGSNELNTENVQSKNVKMNQGNLRKKTDREGDVISNDESEKGETIENDESHKSESKSEKVTRKPKKMLKRKSSSSNNQSPKKFKNNKTKSKAEGGSQLKSDKKNKEKGRKKKIVVNNESEGESSDAGPEEYEVEKIVDIYFKRNGEREFLVRWKGYSPKYDTWEPEKHLNCNELLEAFMKKCEEAKKNPLREMRTDRRKTDRYVVNDRVRGRKSSARLRRRPRKTYYDSN